MSVNYLSIKLTIFFFLQKVDFLIEIYLFYGDDFQSLYTQIITQDFGFCIIIGLNYVP